MDDVRGTQLGRANEDTEMTRSVFVILTLAAVPLVSCGGNDSPAAPTPVATPTTPIVVTLTAQVVANVVQGLKTVDDRGFVDRRNIRVTGNVAVTGGNATVEAMVTLPHTIAGANPASPIVTRIFASSPLAPNTGGIDFTTDIPFSVPPGGPVPPGSATVTVQVTGTDARGGTVNVSRDLSFDPELSVTPTGTCVDTDTVLCAGDRRFAFDAFWRDADNDTGHAVVTTGQRFANKAWFSFPGASTNLLDPDGLDLLVELVDGCADSTNTYWVFAVSSTELEITLTATDTVTG